MAEASTRIDPAPAATAHTGTIPADAICGVATVTLPRSPAAAGAASAGTTSAAPASASVAAAAAAGAATLAEIRVAKV